MEHMSEIEVVKGLTRKLAVRQNTKFTVEQIDRCPNAYHRHLLRSWDVMHSYAKIAEMQRSPIGTIKSGLYRAREALNKLV